MNVEEIVTEADFLAYIQALSQDGASAYQGSLEEYLRAVWAEAQEYRKGPVTFRLLAEVLTNAFAKEPLLFDEQWLVYKSLPKTMLDQLPVEDTFEELQHMILYQIADLHRMEDEGLLSNPYRYYGIDSPTGFNWYNFDPETFLECASRGLGSGSSDTQCDWGYLAVFLWLGQIYE